MTLKELIDWCDKKGVPHDAKIILRHPGGWDHPDLDFVNYTYEADDDAHYIEMEGTG